MSLYQFSRSLVSLFRAGAYEYSNLEVPDGDEHGTAFATKDNGMISFIKINGSFTHIGARRIEETVHDFIRSTSRGMKGLGQRVDFVYIRDKGRGPQVAHEAISPLRRAMRARRMDLDFFLDEQEELLGEDLVYESAIIVLTTNLVTLDKGHQEAALSRRSDRANKIGSNVYSGDFCQNPLAVVEGLRSAHESNLESLANGLKKTCSSTVMTCRDIMHAIRMESAPDFTGKNWSPSLPSEDPESRQPIKLSKEAPVEWDLSNLLHPSTGYQMFPLVPQPAEEDRSLVRVGNSYQAPLLIDSPPASPREFSAFTDALPKDVPVRMILSMETGHEQIMHKVHNKRNKAQFLAWSSSQTKAVMNAADAIIKTSKHDLIVSCSMAACTWGDTLTEAQHNKNRLAKTLQNWGGIEVIEERADSPRAWATTLPGFSHNSLRLAPTWPYPYKDVIRMAPFAMPVSPYPSGPVLYRSMHDTLYPIMPTSSLQDTWVDYFFAPPGKGKSVTMSYHNLSFLLNNFYKTLPCLSILDIGPSAENTLNLIREALPEDEKHLAQFYRLQMTRESAINPFDTPLGCRTPVSLDAQILRSIVKAAFAPTGSLAKTGVPMIDELCSTIIERLYYRYSDQNGDDCQPKVYEKSKDSRIDEALMNRNIPAVTGEWTWWKVVDELFDAGDIVSATRAQRFAVPTFMDINELISEDETIRRSYGDLTVGPKMSLFDYMATMLRSIARDLPIIANETALDIANARIVAMDLSEVTPQGSQDFEVKQTSMMFLLGRYAVSKNFYRRADMVVEFPEKYREHHREHIEDISQAPKCLVMDEIHRCVGFEAVANQLELDCREGRKFDIRIVLASQYLDDLPPDIAKAVQNFYVMSLGTAQEAKVVIDKLNIHKDVVEVMQEYCNGPGKRGLYHLVISQLKSEGGSEDNGSFTDNIVNAKQGKRMLLGQSTTQEDREIRRRMVDLVGLSNGLLLMSKEIPGGKAKPYIEQRNRRGDFDSISGNIYDEIVSDIMRKHGAALE